jgi:DNA-binding XRE family transcriptional regulator
MSGKKICNNQDVEANVGSDNHSSPNTELKPKQRSHKSSTELRLCQRKFYEECPSSAITDTVYTAGVTGMDFWEISETSLNGCKNFSKGRVELQIRDRFDLTDFAEIAYQAKEIIAQNFGEETLKLHYALAMIAFRKPEAWKEEITVSASKLLADFGENNKKKHYIPKAERDANSQPARYLSKEEKLRALVHHGYLLKRLEVSVKAWRIRNKTFTIEHSNLWEIFQITEVFHQEDKNTLIDIEITYRPGKWFEKFAGHKYLREFGYITSEALKLDPYQEKMALRLAYFALFALQQHKSGRYQIETLLTRIGYENDIETAKRNGVAASNLKRSFDRGLKTLGNFEYPYLFDYEPDVPDWAHPNSKVKKPHHWFETWLQLNGTLRQPEALPKHPPQPEPKPEQPQPPKKPGRKRESAQPAANLTEPIAFGQWVREARKTIGESLRTMAKELEISASQLSQIENGCYPHTIKPSLKTQIIRHLGLNE